MTETAEERRQPLIELHPRAQRGTLADLQQCLGVITLTGPVPSYKFMEDGESEPAPAKRAGD